MIIIIFWYISLLGRKIPILKNFDNSNFGLVLQNGLTEINSGDTSKSAFFKGGNLYLDFQKKNYILGIQTSGGETNCSSKFFEKNLYQLYDGINYFCNRGFSNQDYGMRLGYMHKFKESNFSIYSIFSFGHGTITTNYNFVFGKYDFNNNFFGATIGCSYSFNKKSILLLSDDLLLKIELGYKRSYFDNQYFSKQLTAYHNDYTIGFGVSFQVDYKKQSVDQGDNTKPNE